MDEELSGVSDESVGPINEVISILNALDREKYIGDEYEKSDIIEGEDFGQVVGEIVIGIPEMMLDLITIEEAMVALQDPTVINTVRQLAAEDTEWKDFTIETNRKDEPEIKTFIQDKGIVITVLYTARYENRQTDELPKEENEEEGT